MGCPGTGCPDRISLCLRKRIPLPASKQKWMRIRIELKVIIRQLILAQPGVITGRDAVDRCPAGPATDKQCRQVFIAHPLEPWHRGQFGSFLAHRTPEQPDILPEAAKHKKRTVAGPRWHTWDGRTGKERIRARPGISQQELPRPDQVLTGIAIQPGFRLLIRLDIARGKEITRLLGCAPAYSRLRNTIVQAKVLMAGQIRADIAVLAVEYGRPGGSEPGRESVCPGMDLAAIVTSNHK